MFSKILYYCIVYPLSRLPFGVLYPISDFLYFVLFRLIAYRKKVVINNLKHSFPGKSSKEIRQIAQKFYRYLADVLIEGIKNISISEKQLKSRLKVENPEIMDELFAMQKSVLLVGGHYNNWEWLIAAQNMLFKHQAVGIGQPMSNRFWNTKINEKRSRFGMRVIHAKNLKEKLALWSNEKLSILTLSDQSPAKTNKSYWMNFLNQHTAVLFGAEMMAHQYNMAVVYFETKKIKRGHYLMKLKLITDNPTLCKYGEITEKHTHLLEKTILNDPQFWMWSHKRWKRTPPDDFVTLRAEQEKNFNQKMEVLNNDVNH
jgi:KDO2-lipid IV(A) lauroyltransferase